MSGSFSTCYWKIHCCNGSMVLNLDNNTFCRISCGIFTLFPLEKLIHTLNSAYCVKRSKNLDHQQPTNWIFYQEKDLFRIWISRLAFLLCILGIFFNESLVASHPWSKSKVYRKVRTFKTKRGNMNKKIREICTYIVKQTLFYSQ